MTITRAELRDAARQAFDGAQRPADAAAHRARIAEMGWLAMTVPEDRGGLGLGREAAGVIHVECGRALAPGPVVAQLLAIEALTGADRSAATDDLLARAIAGEVVTASLMPGLGGRGVPDADIATHMLIAGDDRIMLAPLTGARLTMRTTWDETRRLFDVQPAAEGIVLASGAAARTLADRLEIVLLHALAGDAIGGADAILERTIAFLGVRHQFGRPLAMFQALKHRVADMRMRLSAVEALFWARTLDAETSLMAMGALKAQAGTVYRDIAEDAVQLHGGIGLTMEHHCHLFLKRATLDAALGGDADHWNARAGADALHQAGDPAPQETAP